MRPGVRTWSCLVILASGCAHRFHADAGVRWDLASEISVHVGGWWSFGVSSPRYLASVGVGGEYDSDRDIAPTVAAGAIARFDRMTMQTHAFANTNQGGLAIGLGRIVSTSEPECSKPFTFEMHLEESCRRAYGALGAQVGFTSDRFLQLDLTGDLFHLE